KSKGSLYQGGIAVPLIISGKGVTRLGARDQNLINATDLFSTIAQMAGVNASSYQNSASFYPLLSQSTSNNRQYNYSDVLNVVLARSGYTIRDTTYKLFVLDNGTERFYNLKTDPYETNNIIDTLTPEETTIYNNLKKEVGVIRS
uniref:sulfatase/phosphatase domain-containing protein n=1 Tax=Mariniflexile sp. TaxID=1979402 RepID=UPI0035674AC4